MSTNDQSRILLIEDNPDDRFLIVRYLRRAGLEEPAVGIDEAETLQQAKEYLESARYNCALVDLGLPDGHGVENVTRIHELAPGMPLIVLTGREDDRTAKSVADEGAFAFVVKKVFTDEDDLDRIVLSALSAGPT